VLNRSEEDALLGRIVSLAPIPALLVVVALAPPADADYTAAELALANGNLQRAYDESAPLADHGDARALILLGVFYQSGWIVERNPEQAAAFYQQAADMGLSRAIHNLGRLYRSRLGVPQDNARAA
tara:strand:- start:11717 stop:12094 length:378 start_codon:yes stop_codon:yes gene_type:complete